MNLTQRPQSDTEKHRETSPCFSVSLCGLRVNIIKQQSPKMKAQATAPHVSFESFLQLA